MPDADVREHASQAVLQVLEADPHVQEAHVRTTREGQLCHPGQVLVRRSRRREPYTAELGVGVVGPSHGLLDVLVHVSEEREIAHDPAVQAEGVLAVVRLEARWRDGLPCEAAEDRKSKKRNKLTWQYDVPY